VAAVHAAAQIPEIRVVVTESVFSSIDSSWQRIIERLTGMSPAPFVLWFVDRETGVPASQVDLMADLPLIRPRPMLFMHGAQDPIVDVWHSQRMYDAASETSVLYIVEEGGHVDLARVDPAGYAAQISDFLHQYLRGL
jgi:fermentation-respiration switch protein FrsA (DUF1100 family)